MVLGLRIPEETGICSDEGKATLFRLSRPSTVPQHSSNLDLYSCKTVQRHGVPARTSHPYIFSQLRLVETNSLQPMAAS